MTFTKFVNGFLLTLPTSIEHQHAAPVEKVLQLMHLIVRCSAARKDYLDNQADLVNDVFDLVNRFPRIRAPRSAYRPRFVLLARLLVSWHLLVPSLIF